jgi:hypothetical protein
MRRSILSIKLIRARAIKRQTLHENTPMFPVVSKIAYRCSSREALDVPTHRRQLRTATYGTMPISMGPVTASVTMYVAERVLSRLIKRQIFRKGIIRKIRYLFKMLIDLEMVYEILYDILEDMAS